MNKMGLIRDKILLSKFRKEWKKVNLHNKTWAQNIFKIHQVSVGKETYGGIYLMNNVGDRKLVIGNYCSIGGEVVFLLGLDHRINCISTYPFKAKMLNKGVEAISKGDIIIDDDVWIGHRATILSGVHIGQGAVVAAGSVVTNDVAPYAVVGGVPAKVLKYRFSDEIIQELLKINFRKLEKEHIENHLVELYAPLTSIEQLDWMPKK